MRPKSFIPVQLDKVDLSKAPEPLKSLIQKVSSSQKNKENSMYDKHDYWTDEPRHEHHRDSSD